MPLGHGVAGLEVLGKVVSSLLPGRHAKIAEAASRSHVLYRYLPAIYRRAPEIGGVHDPEMLKEVILPQEEALLHRLLLAFLIAVSFCMVLIRFADPAVNTHEVSIRAPDVRSLGRTLPSLESQMHRLLVALPRVLLRKTLSAKGTLVLARQLGQPGAASGDVLRGSAPSPPVTGPSTDAVR